MHTSKRFLLVAGPSDSTWSTTLAEALYSLGELDYLAEADSMQAQLSKYTLIIIDTITITDVPALVTSLHRQHPTVPIVVVTSSPTWQRARQVFLSGATDYVRKSLEKDVLRRTFQDILFRVVQS